MIHILSHNVNHYFNEHYYPKEMIRSIIKLFTKNSPYQFYKKDSKINNLIVQGNDLRLINKNVK